MIPIVLFSIVSYWHDAKGPLRLGSSKLRPSSRTAVSRDLFPVTASPDNFFVSSAPVDGLAHWGRLPGVVGIATGEAAPNMGTIGH